MAYTYLIGWSKLDRWYYGVRYSKSSHPDELWVTYHTSSKYVKEFALIHGKPDIIQIRKIFDNSNKAVLWEHKVLKRMNVIYKDNWLNKTDNKGIPLEYSMHGWSNESREKQRSNRLGKKHSNETCKKISKAHKGRKTPWLTGKKRPDHSYKMKGENNPKAIRILYNNKEFGTLKEFAASLNISVNHARKLINNNEAKRIT